MNKLEKLVLIEGEFEVEQAKEILMNIFSTKIHFHEMKNFSSQVRFGKHDETAQKRVAELRKSVTQLLKILDEAQSSNKKLTISSAINIGLSD